MYVHTEYMRDYNRRYRATPEGRAARARSRARYNAKQRATTEKSSAREMPVRETTNATWCLTWPADDMSELFD